MAGPAGERAKRSRHSLTDERPGCNSPGAFPFLSRDRSACRQSKSPCAIMRSRPRREARERAGAVAELVLDQRAQLAECLVVFGDQEQRIVAEPAGPRGSRVNRPRQAPSASSRIVAGGIGQGQRAAKRRAAAVIGQFGQWPRAACDCWPRRRTARRRSAPRTRPARRPARRRPGPNRRR